MLNYLFIYKHIYMMWVTKIQRCFDAIAWDQTWPHHTHTHTNTHQTKPNNCAPKKLAMKGKKNVELKLLHLLFSHRHLQKQTQHAYACTKRGSAYMIFHGIRQGCLCIYALCLSLCLLDPLYTIGWCAWTFSLPLCAPLMTNFFFLHGINATQQPHTYEYIL